MVDMGEAWEGLEEARAAMFEMTEHSIQRPKEKEELGHLKEVKENTSD